ncbi:MAG: hemolysin family protein [Candidatus Syntrophosphaera sp.]|nr:hemolysin family protein [Candidatus Syntrophosphaera sp.]
MDDGSAFLLILLLLLSAYFSGSETAFFSLPRIYLKKLENGKAASAKRILSLLRQPRRLLITILLGNTFVNMAITSLATIMALRIAERLGRSPSPIVTAQVVITTLVIVIFCEIIPKLVALSTANVFARLSSLPMQVLNLALLPLVWLIEKLSMLASSKQGADRILSSRFTTEEFHSLIQSESSQHSLDEHEKQMLVGLFRFREAKLTEIYVPRVRMKAIEVDQSLDELRDLIVSSGFSRIPVYRETIDEIIGIIYVKDLVLYPEKKRIADIMRPAWFVTENMKVQTLLNQFKTRKLQMAVVVDEYGGTSGIISLEDILEEIVGEIHDEYDRDEVPEFTRVDDSTFKLRGAYNIRQFNHEFNAEIDPEEYDNVAEFLLSQFNHVPAVGETYVLESCWEFRVLESNGRSINLVQVKKLDE